MILSEYNELKFDSILDADDPVNSVHTLMQIMESNNEDHENGEGNPTELVDDALNNILSTPLNRQLRSRSYLFRTKKDASTQQGNLDDSHLKVATRGAYLFRT